MFLAAMIAGLLALQAVPPQRAVLDRYCLTCHTQRAKDRGVVPIALDNVDVSNVAADAELWEKVLRKMRGGLMPPPGAPRPDEVSKRNLLSWLETQLDRAAAANPNPG